MTTKVGVVDYGAGNLLNVVNALLYCGADVFIITTPQQFIHADRIILPGVGAFQDGMSVLKEKNLIEPIINYIATERPYLGICLGMQFLFEKSHEFGVTNGLGVFPGEVLQIPSTTESGQKRRVPHIGWSQLHSHSNSSKFDSPLLKNVSVGEYFYFVHSYMCVPQDKDIISSIASYMELSIPAFISHNNIYGTQFHPEKSGKAGLNILQNFLKI